MGVAANFVLIATVGETIDLSPILEKIFSGSGIYGYLIVYQ